MRSPEENPDTPSKHNGTAVLDVHVVVVDDEPGIRDSLRRIFEREHYRVSVTDSGHEALDIVRKESVDLVLADIMMPKMSGIDLLRAIKAVSPAVEVVMMTAFGTVENAVQCMREGAYDFIPKPLKRAIVVRSVQRALERRALVHENKVLRQTVAEHSAYGSRGIMVGQSHALTTVLEVVRQAAPSAATMLLLGESGTGKEMIARMIHRHSDRRDRPFVAVNCAALPEALLESELFGHEEGAFTGASKARVGRFERAEAGTIFLDEIGETSPAVQVRLLRVLQEGEIERLGGQEVVSVNVRVVAATNRDITEEIRKGRFREDLFYRLNVIEVRMPPLRERRGDVALLAQHFLGVYSQKNSKPVRGFSEAALKSLDLYGWPGNVRELENTIERAVVLTRDDMITLEMLPGHIQAAAQGVEVQRPQGDMFHIPFGTKLADIERTVIKETLARTGGNKTTAAQILGIASRTIYRKLNE